MYIRVRLCVCVCVCVELEASNYYKDSEIV